MPYNRCLTSPSRRPLEVALHYLIRRDNPSSKEGIKIHHYSGSSPTINVGQQLPSGVAKCLRRYAAHLNHVAVWIAELRRARHVRRFDLRPGAFELLDCGLVIE